ncbi:hypothetical protein IVA98_30080 [Bradyrhizobium sp. 160]|uniref:hypothetical protein n=1 Tax=Bradyrhizobium sp. 160 TaxID=2782634 RepID=UPI001FFB5E54|nr:hypothetical protein [Bradyrhizobium sp. 160]MCK1627303.1 hypothetical protein [Bradyrhizobium sp. 160]
MTRWHPSLDLARLLEALSDETLAATDGEVRQMSDLQGWKIANTAQEVRELIRVAGADINGNLDPNVDGSLNDDLDELEAGLRQTREPRCSPQNWRH